MVSIYCETYREQLVEIVSAIDPCTVKNQISFFTKNNSMNINLFLSVVDKVQTSFFSLSHDTCIAISPW